MALKICELFSKNHLHQHIFLVSKNRLRISCHKARNWIRALAMIKNSVKLGDKERFDIEQICVKTPFPMTKCQFTL
jgi:hypothetical protein